MTNQININNRMTKWVDCLLYRCDDVKKNLPHHYRFFFFFCSPAAERDTKIKTNWFGVWFMELDSFVLVSICKFQKIFFQPTTMVYQ